MNLTSYAIKQAARELISVHDRGLPLDSAIEALRRTLDADDAYYLAQRDLALTLPPLQRGEHELPHMSQVLARDNMLDDILVYPGKPARVFRHEVPNAYGYTFSVYHPACIQNWTAFTEEQFRAWLAAYRIDHPEPLPEHGAFIITLPKGRRDHEFRSTDYEDACKQMEFNLLSG